MNYKIERNQPIIFQKPVGGRGNILFPEFLTLKVSKDGENGDCLTYPDTPYNRKKIIQAKCRYNQRGGAFEDRQFTHRYEIRGGAPCIVIQRIA